MPAIANGGLMAENAADLFKYGIALIAVIGAFVLIYEGRGDPVQPWTLLGIIIGWIIRDSGGAAATASVLRVQAAQPTVTATSGPPATVTSTPGGSE